MAHPSKLGAEQIEEMIAMREAGRSYKVIAGQLGVSKGAIHYQCLKHNAISPRQRDFARGAEQRQRYSAPASGNRYFTAEEDARLLALRKSGMTIPAIGRALGRANTSVRIRLLTLAQHDEIAEGEA